MEKYKIKLREANPVESITVTFTPRQFLTLVDAVFNTVDGTHPLSYLVDEVFVALPVELRQVWFNAETVLDSYGGDKTPADFLAELDG